MAEPVFTKDPNCEHGVLPGAHVVLLDGVTRETKSNARGAYVSLFLVLRVLRKARAEN